MREPALLVGDAAAAVELAVAPVDPVTGEPAGTDELDVVGAVCRQRDAQGRPDHRRLPLRVGPARHGPRQREGGAATDGLHQADLLRADTLHVVPIRPRSVAWPRHGPWSCTACRAAAEEQELEGALRLARSAVEMAEEGTATREPAVARLTEGYVLPDSGDEAGARAAFANAHEVFETVGIEGFALEARAAVASTMLAEGRVADAVAVVENLLPHLDGEGLEAAWQPARVGLTCWRVLDAVGDARAAQVREGSRLRLSRRAERIGDDAMAAEYLARPAAVALLG